MKTKKSGFHGSVGQCREKKGTSVTLHARLRALPKKGHLGPFFSLTLTDLTVKPLLTLVLQCVGIPKSRSELSEFRSGKLETGGPNRAVRA